MGSEKIREEFEAWVRRSPGFISGDLDAADDDQPYDYRSVTVQSWWEAWQAALTTRDAGGEITMGQLEDWHRHHAPVNKGTMVRGWLMDMLAAVNHFRSAPTPPEQAVINTAKECVERMLQTNIGRVEPLITAVLDLRDVSDQGEPTGGRGMVQDNAQLLPTITPSQTHSSILRSQADRAWERGDRQNAALLHSRAALMEAMARGEGREPAPGDRLGEWVCVQDPAGLAGLFWRREGSQSHLVQVWEA